MLALELAERRDPHLEHCQPGQCAFPAEEEGYTEVGPPGQLIRFNGCPLLHADPEVPMWVAWYRWRKEWNTSPITEGLITVQQMDPRYFDAIELINLTLARLAPKSPNGR